MKLLPGRSIAVTTILGLRKELTTKADYDEFLGSFEINFTEVSNGRPAWLMDCRDLNDPGCGKLLKRHVGKNPRIMNSSMASPGYHELHSRLYEDMSRLISRQNIVIMICRDGRYRAVANAEMWTNTLTELTERFERFDKSVGAPTGCLHTQDTNRQADLSMIKAAKKMYKNLLGKANAALKKRCHSSLKIWNV